MWQQTFIPDLNAHPENRHTFDTGAVRQDNSGEGRYDLIPSVGLKRLAQTCEYGSKKYGDNNWLKGIPLSNLLNHALIHIYAYLDISKGNEEITPETEDHLAHAAWNLLAAMHMEQKMPGMNDL